MNQQENVILKLKSLGDSAKTYESITGTYDPAGAAVGAYLSENPGKSVEAPRRLAICDPITQLCKRIEGFFRGCPGITVKYKVNNNQRLDWKTDEHGEYITGIQRLDDGTEITVFYSEDHITELRIYVDDEEQAPALANVIRHRHVINEEFGMSSPIDGEDAIGRRSHILIVHVMLLGSPDPMNPAEGGQDPYSTEDDNPGAIVRETYGTFPIDWNDMDSSGEQDRLAPDAPDSTAYPDLPHGFPEEYEQMLWENGFDGTNIDGSPVSVSMDQALKWKWKWLRTALRNNRNVVDMSFEFNDGMNTWRFIECGRLPIVFNEDNLTSARGFNSILPADLLPTIFSVFGRYCIATYARQSMLK